MSGFRRGKKGITARFSTIEAELLVGLASQLVALVTDRGEAGSDPVLERLFPVGYSDVSDPERTGREAEFRRFTEEELATTKSHAALTLIDALPLDGNDTTIRVVLDRGQALLWAGSINDMRLALSIRLDLSDDGLPRATGDDLENVFAVFSWLGSLLDSLVSAID